MTSKTTEDPRLAILAGPPTRGGADYLPAMRQWVWFAEWALPGGPALRRLEGAADDHLACTLAREAMTGLQIATTQPSHVGHHSISAAIAEMRRTNRHDLINYAGASYRDPVAWAMCQEWCLAPTASEKELKKRALVRAESRLRDEMAMSRTRSNERP
jgi:hypothetical protein